MNSSLGRLSKERSMYVIRVTSKTTKIIKFKTSLLLPYAMTNRTTVAKILNWVHISTMNTNKSNHHNHVATNNLGQAQSNVPVLQFQSLNAPSQSRSPDTRNM
jgi:hypothetical protein